jgi:hypothetical protein
VSPASRALDRLAALGLLVGAVFGLAGTLVASPHVQASLWATDGVGLVPATSLLALKHFRDGSDIVAGDLLVFAIGEGVLLSGTAAGPAGSQSPPVVVHESGPTVSRTSPSLRAAAPGEASDAAAELRLELRNGVLVVPLGGILGDVTFARPEGTGQLVLHTRTSGAELDPDGYGVRLDGNASVAIGVNDSLVLRTFRRGDTRSRSRGSRPTAT